MCWKTLYPDICGCGFMDDLRIYQQSPEEGIWFPNLLVSRKGDVGGVCRRQHVGKCAISCLIWQIFVFLPHKVCTFECFNLFQRHLSTFLVVEFECQILLQNLKPVFFWNRWENLDQYAPFSLGPFSMAGKGVLFIIYKFVHSPFHRQSWFLYQIVEMLFPIVK